MYGKVNVETFVVWVFEMLYWTSIVILWKKEVVLGYSTSYGNVPDYASTKNTADMLSFVAKDIYYMIWRIVINTVL